MNFREQYLRALRKKRLTKGDVARRLGCAPSNVFHALEDEGRTMTVPMMEKYAQVIGMKVTITLEEDNHVRVALP